MNPVSSRLLKRYASLMLESARAHGFTATEIADATRVDMRRLEREAITEETFCRISGEVKLLMRDEFCGFTPVPCPIGTFYDACERATKASTVGDGLRRAFEVYGDNTDDVQFGLSTSGEIASLSVTLRDYSGGNQPFLYEWWFLIWRALIAWLSPQAVPVLAADFPFQAGELADEYAETLSGICRFQRPVARLLLPESCLRKPVRRAVSELPTLMQRPTMRLLGGSAQQRFKHQLKGVLRMHLAETQELLSIEDAASAYHICSQTLRRRLQLEWTSYRAVKEEVRREAAICWLERRDMSIGEVSHLAGYAEPNGLTRALKSWAGISPTSLRCDAAL
jgi:AraC-like DNA-binding protein